MIAAFRAPRISFSPATGRSASCMAASGIGIKIASTHPPLRPEKSSGMRNSGRTWNETAATVISCWRWAGGCRWSGNAPSARVKRTRPMPARSPGRWGIGYEARRRSSTPASSPNPSRIGRRKIPQRRKKKEKRLNSAETGAFFAGSLPFSRKEPKSLCPPANPSPSRLAFLPAYRQAKNDMARMPHTEDIPRPSRLGRCSCSELMDRQSIASRCPRSLLPVPTAFRRPSFSIRTISFAIPPTHRSLAHDSSLRSPRPSTTSGSTALDRDIMIPTLSDSSLADSSLAASTPADSIPTDPADSTPDPEEKEPRCARYRSMFERSITLHRRISATF